MMTTTLYFIMAFFWAMLIYYSILTIAGIAYRLKRKTVNTFSSYPSVALLIPAHNEGIVIKDTLEAMSKLKYPGELNIYVLDDSSSDDTAVIAQEFQMLFSKFHHIVVPPGEPKGKSRVLNYGLSISQSDYFIVFDADNQPEPDALIHLVHRARLTEKAAGAVGYVKTLNAKKNILTRMIALEFQVFQLLMQCGRWHLFKLGSLAGTNMLLKRKVIEELGGYDPYALAEDAELTIRITSAGYTLPVAPESRTWEQEPENVWTFIKQRTRWLTGNLYLLEKTFSNHSYWKGKTVIHTLQHILTYLLFVLLLLFSDFWFFAGIFGWVKADLIAPVLMLWFMSYIVYTFQLLSSLVVDKNISFGNAFFALIMYFTYAQLFIILLTRSGTIYIWNRSIRKKTMAWDKTKRFKKIDA